MNQDPEGIPTRHVLLAFFAVVLLCAVFFSLGFFLGHQERNPSNAPATEQVSPSSDIPPTVNPPAEPQSSTASEEAGGPTAPATSSPTGGVNSAAAEHPAAAPPEPPPSSAPAAAKPPEKGAASSRMARRSNGGASEAPEAGSPIVSARTKLPPGLTVQVAALSSQQDAVNMVDVLKSRGYPALLLAPDRAHSKDIFFRVIVGPYKTTRQVDQVRSKLAAEGFKPFIRQ
jgi:cell division septation protein DedD